MPDPLKIAYLGPEATFTHQAARKAFGTGARYVAAETVDDVFSMVQQGFADHGVAPVENSNEGVVSSTLDLLADSSLMITGEIIIPVRLALLSRENDLSDIRTVYSHPHALAQCRQWIMRNLPEAKVKDTRSTAEAAALCQEMKRAGAVAGDLVAELYDLPILADDIGDWDENLTRFLIFSTGSVESSGQDKTSVLLSIKDRVGALYDILHYFGDAGINLTKIESRPSRRKAWDYVFFVDLEGHRDDENVHAALEKVRDHCMSLKILGSYPKGNV